MLLMIEGAKKYYILLGRGLCIRVFVLKMKTEATPTFFIFEKDIITREAILEIFTRRKIDFCSTCDGVRLK